MSFWQNVEDEREYQNMSRKELAQKAHFAVSGISLGLAHNSVPSADVAVRIANILHVSVEYLVTGTESNAASHKAQNQADVRLFHKYAKTLRSLDILPAPARTPIISMVDDMATSFAAHNEGGGN